MLVTSGKKKKQCEEEGKEARTFGRKGRDEGHSAAVNLTLTHYYFYKTTTTTALYSVEPFYPGISMHFRRDN